MPPGFSQCLVEFSSAGQCSAQGLSLDDMKKSLQFSTIDKYGKYTDSSDWLRKLPLGRWYLFDNEGEKILFCNK